MSGEASIDEVLRQGQAAWPAVELAAEQLRRALPWLEQSVAPRFGADVYLAAAALSGVRAALALFDDRFLARVPQFIRKVVPDPDLAADVQQSLRERLLWSPSGPGKLAEYRGAGPLGAWICVVAVRAAMRIARGEERYEHAGDALDLSFARDPHDEAVKSRYREAFNSALRQVLESRPEDERRMLRRYYAEGATLAEIAREVGVNVSTVWRRLQATRRELLASVRAQVVAATGIAPDEFDSLTGVLGSQVDVRLSALMTGSGR